MYLKLYEKCPWIVAIIEGKRSRTPFVKPIIRDTGIKL